MKKGKKEEPVAQETNRTDANETPFNTDAYAQSIDISNFVIDEHIIQKVAEKMWEKELIQKH